MSAPEDSGRISVSRDALRAELALMELRLVEKLASKADVDDLERRVEALEERDSPNRSEWDAIKAWQLVTKGALAVLTTVALAGLPLLIKHYTG